MPLEQNNKKIARNTLFLYVRMAFILFVSLYTSRVVLNVLGVVDYGVYNVVAGFVTMFGFLNSSFTACIQRYYNYENGKNGFEGICKVYSISCVVQVVLAIIVLAAIESFGLYYINNKLVIPPDRLHAANILFQCSTISLIAIILQVPFSAIVMSMEKMHFYAFVGMADVVMKLLMVLALPHLPGDKLVTYSFLFLLTAFFDFFSYYIYSKVKFNKIRFSKKLSIDTMKEMASFSGWNILGALAMVARGQGLNIILNLFFGPIVNAARGISFQIQAALISFINNIYTAVRPQLTESYASGNVSRSVQLVYTYSKVCFFIMLLLSVPVAIRIDYILNLWLGSEVPEGTNIFSIMILLVSLIDLLNTPITLLTMASGKIKKYCFVSSVLGLLVLPLAYVSIKLFNMPIAVYYASILVSFIVQIACVIICYKIIGKSPIEYCRSVFVPIVKVLLLAPVIPIVINSKIPQTFLGLLAICFISVVSICVISYYFGLDKGEKRLVLDYWNHLNNRRISK